MMHAKITKISSTHSNLRTNEMEGKTPVIPEVGESFFIFGQSLTPGMNSRIIQTTEVKTCEWFPADRKFVFTTLNSTYEVVILDELTEEQIMSHGKWKKV